MSACVVLAWCLLFLTAAIGTRGPDHPAAQANTSTATSISTGSSGIPLILASDSVAARPALVTHGPARDRVTADPARHTATWTVRPGDTLSGIADGLGVPGGWQALYAANRHAIGPNPNLIHAGAVLALPAAGRPARYTVAPGDTLSGIAAALGVPGGWQALYAANRHAVGPSPDVIRPGTVLSAPRQAVPTGTQQTVRQAAAPPAAPAPARTRQQGSRPLSQARPPAGNGGRSRGHLTAPGHLVVQAVGMPRWLEDVLVAAGVLAATAFAAEPAAALARRRKATGAATATRSAPAARPSPAASSAPVTPPSAVTRPSPAAWLASVARPAWQVAPAVPPGRARPPASRARIILADYERLIVTYCPGERAVYVLAPPGEDPNAVLNAARLVLPEDSYQDLAGHLGVPAAWPLE